MKKIVILSVCIVFILSSCKKNSPKPAASSVNNLSATVNGTNETFNSGLVASYSSASSGGPRVLSINGLTANSATADYLEVVVIPTSGSTALTTGTYSSNNLAVVFAKNQTTDYYNIDSNDAATGTVTITSISSTNIQGTFSAPLSLLNSSSSAATGENITSGTFNVVIN